MHSLSDGVNGRTKNVVAYWVSEKLEISIRRSGSVVMAEGGSSIPLLPGLLKSLCQKNEKKHLIQNKVPNG